MKASGDEYELLSSTPIFDGKVVKLRTDQVRMSNGEVAVREVVAHPGAVAIVALDDRDQIVLVRQYRHPVRRYLDELPAGLLDVTGESSLGAAQRELYEEAALRAGRWQVLLDLYTSPGMTDELIRVFLARELSEVPVEERFAAQGEELTMTVYRVALPVAVQRVLSGEITNGPAIAGILAAAAARDADYASLRPVTDDTP